MIRKSIRKLTFRSAARYFFAFSLLTKVVFLYITQHPPKEALLPVQGTVRQSNLGGNGSATSFRIQSDKGTYRYSSYYGKVWPGMEHIHPGDSVQLLAEKNEINPHELVTGKQYYIWELIHNNRIIFAYEDVDRMIQSKEATVNRYMNGFLAASILLLLSAYINKVFPRGNGTTGLK